MFRCSFRVRAVVLLWLGIMSTSTTAAAQTSTPCSAPLELTGDFGFTGLQCKGCSFGNRGIPGLADWVFSTEPTLSGITRGGPADGKLEELDVLVALNGQLITTQAGALLFSRPIPSKPVRVTLRRAGALRDVEVVPAPRCRTITAAASPWMVGGRFGMLTLSEPAPNPMRASRGTFGVNLSCGSCGLDVAAVVPFSTHPEITNVAADSPAAKAGLKAGDLLVAMDNLSLRSAEGTRAFRDLKPGQKVLVSVLRDAELLKLWLTAGPPSGQPR